MWWPAAAIPLLALIAFAPGIHNGFVRWDDDVYIVHNPLLARPDGLRWIWFSRQSPQYYPLTFTSYWVEYQLWGPWPTGYFLTNLVLHAANSLMVFLVARALGVGGRVSWLVGALFAVHPLQVSSVAWLAQRKNVLCGLFYFLTILLYVRYRRRGEAATYLASLLTYAGALLSKTVAVTLPISLLLAEWLRLVRPEVERHAGLEPVALAKRRFRIPALADVLNRPAWSPLPRLVPMFALAVGLGLVTVFTERAAAPDVPGAAPQPLAAAAAVWVYLKKVFWPARLLALYPQWQVSAGNPIWWLSAGGLIAACLTVWRCHDLVGKVATWGLAHFLCALSPTLGLVPFGFLLKAPVGDHFVYLALPGVFLATLCAAEKLLKASRWRSGPDAGRMRCGSGPAVGRVARAVATALAGIIAAALLLVLSVKTWKQVQLWHDGVRLWSHTLAHNPGSALAHNNLGVALADQGRLEEALLSYRQAARLRPDFLTARTNAALTLIQLGRWDEAVVELRGIVRDAPGDAAAHVNLANALVQQGWVSEALPLYAAAVKLAPQSAEVWLAWGQSLFQAGRDREALTALDRAAELARAAGQLELVEEIESIRQRGCELTTRQGAGQ